MKCGSCGKDNPPEARFCANCGTTLAPTVEPPSPAAVPSPLRVPHKWLLVGGLAVLVILGISFGLTLFSDGTEITTTVPKLLSPADGATLDNGRTDRLDDIIWDFDWSDVEGATQYHLYIIGSEATIPVIDSSNITSSSYHHVSHGSYIAEYNRYGWTWKVRAKVDGQWSEWSETWTFDVEPVNTDPWQDTTSVTLPDANLEAAIRGALNKPQGPIYNSDLESLTTLMALESGILDLTGLEYCVNLSSLVLVNNNISDISALAGLTNLESLHLLGNNISDISPLAGLTNLWDLWLADNYINDISVLSGLTKLQVLVLDRNNISDISPLVDNSGLLAGDLVDLSRNPLSTTSVNVYIPQLEARGVDVRY